ncbi:MAG: hypothetical protein Q7R82_02460 [Candidatus Daviesbacteria bacterium]|nr:hypothetical protein [Candidatus Daviesbacteria bacterium]
MHVGAASTLEKADWEYISEEVLGIFHDGRIEQLVVNCSGKDGFKTPRLVADKVAAILGGKEPKGNGENWRGSYIVSLCPAPQLPEPKENKIRIIGEATLHAKKLELLRSDPARVIPLPFLEVVCL